MPDSPYTRAWTLIGFDAFVTSKGGDPIGMLAAAGLDPRALEAPDMLIPFARKGALLEAAAQELGAASAGLELALNIAPHFPDAGPVLLLAETGAPFGDWLERSIRYWRLQTNAVSLQVLQHEDIDAVGLRITRKGSLPLSRQHAEHIAGKLTRLMRAALDNAADPVRVSFRHPRPEDTALHDALFRCRLEFGAGHDEILFHRDILARPVGRRAGDVEAIANAFLRHRIGLLAHYRPGVSTSTALAVRTVLGAGICSREFIARLLGCSPRKLQRLLALEGTTYEDVLDTTRREMACELLADSSAPVSVIGAMLDFASPAAMTLAMRRWTGMTPSGYRGSTRAVAEAELAA